MFRNILRRPTAKRPPSPPDRPADTTVLRTFKRPRGKALVDSNGFVPQSPSPLNPNRTVASHPSKSAVAENPVQPLELRGPVSRSLNQFARGNIACQEGKWQSAEVFWDNARADVQPKELESLLGGQEGRDCDVEHRARILYHTAVMRLGTMDHGVANACQAASYRLRASEKLKPDFYPASFALGVVEMLLGNEQAAREALVRGLSRYARVKNERLQTEEWQAANLQALLRRGTDMRVSWGLAYAARARCALRADPPRLDEAGMILSKARNCELNEVLLEELEGEYCEQLRITGSPAAAIANLDAHKFEWPSPMQLQCSFPRDDAYSDYSLSSSVVTSY